VKAGKAVPDFATADRQLDAILAKLSIVQSAKDPQRESFVQVLDTKDAWSKVGVSPEERTGLGVRVNEYEGRKGRGWAVVATLTDGKSRWGRVAQSGPETKREAPWTLLEELA
jgi:hypothetical protein